MSTPQENFDLWKILYETKLVIRSHGRHYLLLSLLFLLPTSFFIIIYPFFLQKIFFNPDLHLPFAHFPTIVNLLYIFTVIVLSISGTASVTYTTIHALCHKPVELITSVKSILPSFLPLASSLITQEFILGSFSWPMVKEFLQIYIKHETSNYYKEEVTFNLFFMILLRLALLLTLICLQANWTLSSVVAVCESNNNKGGFKPLRRSSQLVQGKTWVAISMVLLFDLMFATFISGFYNVCESSSRRWGVLDLFYMMLSLVFMIATLLLNMVGNVVLYFYCIEMHGELPLPYSTIEETPLPYSTLEEASLPK